MSKILYTIIMTFSMLQFKALEAPPGYIFKDPDTGRVFKDTTKPGIIKQIVSYRAQNDLEPLDYLGVVIEAYMCSLPRYRHQCEPAKPFSRSIFGYVKGGVALLKNMFYGETNMVNQRTADRRAEQCSTCKFNVFPDKSTFLKWSDAVAEASTHGRKSKFYNKLGNCDVCSCPLKAKVWYKGSSTNLSSEDTAKFEEVKCWQLNK